MVEEAVCERNGESVIGGVVEAVREVEEEIEGVSVAEGESVETAVKEGV